MEKPMMFDSADMLYGVLKSQMEEMEANREKYEAEGKKRKAKSARQPLKQSSKH